MEGVRTGRWDWRVDGVSTEFFDGRGIVRGSYWGFLERGGGDDEAGGGISGVWTRNARMLE